MPAKGNTNKRRGSNYERRVLAKFAKLPHFLYGMRAAGSLGDWDLIAVYANRIAFIQCKITPTNTDRRTVLDAAKAFGSCEMPVEFYLNTEMVLCTK